MFRCAVFTTFLVLENIPLSQDTGTEEIPFLRDSWQVGVCSVFQYCHGYYTLSPLTANPVLELRVNCSSSNVTVYLPSPELPSFVCVKEIHLWALCLHQESIYRV